MSLDPEEYFPADYRVGRHNFIAACEQADIDVIARVHPKASGRDGKPLFLDTAIIGPRDAKGALLLISATHGVEGYFGSGVQTGLMREGLAKRAPRDTKIVLLTSGIRRKTNPMRCLQRKLRRATSLPPQ
jgi:hypothetical protein